MICAQFIFEPGEYDEEFHRLDGIIESEARAMTGFVGVDRWVSEDGTRINAIYYFEDMSGLTRLGRIPEHRDAKGKVSRWYRSYRVIISTVTATYGDGSTPHRVDRVVT